MREALTILYEGGVGEFVEKKSRFIASLLPVKSQEEALCFIESIKKKYWNASHNCSAYVIGEEHQIQRCSDDGEPNQTAGKPMLDVLLSQDIHNVCVVVSRYFGGTLLGTGGLIRAYGMAVKMGLSESEVMTLYTGYQIELTVSYHQVGKIQHLISELGVFLLHSEYGEEVSFSLVIPTLKWNEVAFKITEATCGTVEVKKSDQIRFGHSKEELLLFDI